MSRQELEDEMEKGPDTLQQHPVAGIAHAQPLSSIFEVLAELEDEETIDSNTAEQLRSLLWSDSSFTKQTNISGGVLGFRKVYIRYDIGRYDSENGSFEPTACIQDRYHMFLRCKTTTAAMWWLVCLTAACLAVNLNWLSDTCEELSAPTQHYHHHTDNSSSIPLKLQFFLQLFFTACNLWYLFLLLSYVNCRSFSVRLFVDEKEEEGVE